MPLSDEARRWLALLLECASMAITLWLLWMYVPEAVKIELRRAVQGVLVPFRAAQANRRAHQEMMADVIELITYGPPDRWAAC